MERKARSQGPLGKWTGSILPVLAIALLAAGPVHGKDKKKKQKQAETAQTQAGNQEDAANPPKSEKKGESSGKDARETPRPAPRISLDEAIEQAQRRHKARVVRAERSESDGRMIYVLRLLSDERVWVVKVDSESGKEE